MAAYCAICGSSRIIRPRQRLLDRALFLLSGWQVWTCIRCGWKGRRRWSNDDIISRAPSDDSSASDSKIFEAPLSAPLDLSGLDVASMDQAVNLTNDDPSESLHEAFELESAPDSEMLGSRRRPRITSNRR